jgi:hypothetical protein
LHICGNTSYLPFSWNEKGWKINCGDTLAHYWKFLLSQPHMISMEFIFEVPMCFLIAIHRLLEMHWYKNQEVNRIDLSNELLCFKICECKFLLLCNVNICPSKFHNQGKYSFISTRIWTSSYFTKEIFYLISMSVYLIWSKLALHMPKRSLFLKCIKTHKRRKIRKNLVIPPIFILRSLQTRNLF